MMTYQEAVDYIEETPKFTKKNSLDHTRAFLKRLGSPEDSMKILHVAGTNGKGSVCSFLASILHAAGKSTALFTSPHPTVPTIATKLKTFPVSSMTTTTPTNIIGIQQKMMMGLR